VSEEPSQAAVTLPVPDLHSFTAKQQNILYFLAQSDNKSQVARLAGVERKTIYEAMKSERFMAALQYLKQPDTDMEEYRFLQSERSRLIEKMVNIAGARISDAFDEEGTMKNPREWPRELQDAVAAINYKRSPVLDAEGKVVLAYSVAYSLRVKDDMKAIQHLFMVRGYGPDAEAVGHALTRKEEPKLAEGQFIIPAGD